MALFVPGSIASVVSGKIGGAVYARNRGGNYIRSYAIPTKVTSLRAQLIKSVFGMASQHYANLDSDDIAAWDQYARENPVSNRIGQLVTLKGQAFSVGCNARLLAAGNAEIDVPPILPSPYPSPATAFTVDLNGSIARFALAAHDDNAHLKCLVYGARSVSPGKRYLANLYTHIYTSAAGPCDANVAFFDELEAALGTIQVGVTYHIKVELLDTRTGLITAPQFLSVAAVDTT